MAKRRPPFDPVQASFYLVAAVIGTYVIIALMGAGACLYYSERWIGVETSTCDPSGRLIEILAAALAAALAFAGGRKIGHKDDDEDDNKGEPP